MEFKSFFNESSKLWTTVFHISPKSNIYRFRPIGHKKGLRAYIGKKQAGIYVAPKFKHALAWASTYVSRKKGDTQMPNERLRKKEGGGGAHGEKGPLHYGNLTIYELKVPKDVLKRSAYESFWEPEYFISDDNLKFISIIKSTTYSVKEIVEMYKRNLNISFRPNERVTIRQLSKTNIAAKYYLELLDLYNNAILRISRRSIFKGEDLVNKEINKLKNYIFKGDSWNTEPIYELNLNQKLEVKKIYDSIRNIINNLV